MDRRDRFASLEEFRVARGAYEAWSPETASAKSAMEASDEPEPQNQNGADTIRNVFHAMDGSVLYSTRPMGAKSIA